MSGKKFRLKSNIQGSTSNFFAEEATVSFVNGRPRRLAQTLTDSAGRASYRQLIPHKTKPDKMVEVFWAKPDGDGPFPVHVYLHGHQPDKKDGGKIFVEVGRLGSVTKAGYVAASISQPGYGESGGSADYCGPFSQEAVLSALEFLRAKPFVKPDKIALVGISRGAILASMVATKDDKLAAVVLASGAYDFLTWFPTIKDHGIKRNILFEAGENNDAFRARSAVYYAGQIKAPVLLLHGAKDENISVRQAELLAEKLRANGTVLRMKIFPDTGHVIPIDNIYGELQPFVEEFLR